MKIVSFYYTFYTLIFRPGPTKKGAWLYLVNEEGEVGSGDISPLEGWSQESLEEALRQLEIKKERLLEINWTHLSWQEEIRGLSLFPSLAFAVESALLTLLQPLSSFAYQTSALFMGSFTEIEEQAKYRQREGYLSAKVKIAKLSFAEATSIVSYLKEHFYLRVDLNRSWNPKKSLEFFSQFSIKDFDYIEEPFSCPGLLGEFPYPFAVDESFLQPLSLQELESFNNLKALIYKPTLQGGFAYAEPIVKWAKARGVAVILSSSFESSLGLQRIGELAKRLSIENHPLGLGTSAFLSHSLS